jgi:acetate kinase
MNDTPVVLCVNSGSSSVKVALFRLGGGSETKLGDELVEGSDPDKGMEAALDQLKSRKLPEPDAVGHRLVHGGPHHHRPERIDLTLLESLRRAAPYAPLHLPAEIRAIEAVARRHPGLPQVACFDTGFHRTLPEVASHLPLPSSLFDRGIRRYGFHGLSYEYVVAELGQELGQRAIIAHLGSGASMVALMNGEAVDTTMGLTPAGGFMMSTRTGDLDPGVLFHLLALGHLPSDLDRMVNHESGLLGVSGASADMRVLLSRRAHDARAALAVDMFCHHLRKAIGGLAAVLGGLDSLIFTGGIGEHAAPVRHETCERLEHLGIHVDPERNLRALPVISAADSPCTVRIVATDEQRTIARHVQHVLFARDPGPA